MFAIIGNLLKAAGVLDNYIDFTFDGVTLNNLGAAYSLSGFGATTFVIDNTVVPNTMDITLGAAISAGTYSVQNAGKSVDVVGGPSGLTKGTVTALCITRNFYYNIVNP